MYGLPTPAGYLQIHTHSAWTLPVRDTLRAFVALDIPALQFAIKTLLGGALALWCAFRFDLQQPQWALMTAFIVAQPLSGMVVQKGLARLFGTLVGTVMSVAIVGLFAQTPWLFLLALATWLGLCTAASTMMRSAWSYAFVLAGYTVAIIGLPAIAHPLTVFDQAVARSTEICLGIICATFTSALLWPQRVERQLARQAREVGGLAVAVGAVAGGAHGGRLFLALGGVAGLGRQAGEGGQRDGCCDQDAHRVVLLTWPRRWRNCNRRPGRPCPAR